MSVASALSIRRLAKSFTAGIAALAGVDLEIEAGEFCVLLGPSGCGKSTLLRCVAGLETPTDGEIWIGQERVDGLEPRQRDVAMVFQNYALYPHMTVYKNLSFPLEMRRFPRAQIEERVRHTAELLKIDPLLARKPGALSGGQRQRVAIGRALVREPKIYLMDEPLSNLDARLREELRGEILRLHRRLRATIVYVTHDQTEAMALGSRVVVMNGGRIEQADPPSRIYARPATRFVAGFVGTPPMNFMSGIVSQKVFRAGDLAIRVPGVPDGPAELGVRAEHLRAGTGDARAQVEFVEDLGADRYAHLDHQESRLIVRLPQGATLQEGREIRFGIDPAGIHLFRDGRRLELSEESSP